jgi:hypothetical protein
MPLLQKSLNNSEYVKHWHEYIKPMARAKFDSWAESGEQVSLFAEMSTLVLTILVHMFAGPSFAERHAAELVPLVQEYEKALQRPLPRLLPRWMSKDGRLLDYVDVRVSELIDEEVLKRIANMDKYKDNMDYLQLVLNVTGAKYRAGTNPRRY